MAINTYGIALKWGESVDAVEQVIAIKDFPDLISPDLLETTTLSDPQHTNIMGIRGSDLMTFTCNYTKEDYTTVSSTENTNLFYELEFSDGSKFSWQGRHVCGVPGKGVNEVVEFTINVSVSTPVEFSGT